MSKKKKPKYLRLVIQCIDTELNRAKLNYIVSEMKKQKINAGFGQATGIVQLTTFTVDEVSYYQPTKQQIEDQENASLAKKRFEKSLKKAAKKQ